MGFNIWNIVIVLLIVVLLFGTKKLRNVGGDLGSALKGFKKALSDDENTAEQKDLDKKAADKADADFESVEDQTASEKAKASEKTVKPEETKTTTKE